MLKRSLVIAVSGAALLAAPNAFAMDFSGIVGGITGADVVALKDKSYPGTDFAQSLARDYKKFSMAEAYDRDDWFSGNHFARKAMAAGHGETVLPERVSDWDVPSQYVEELRTARSKLMTAFSDGARRVAPEQAATAQAKYDCWIEEQDENHEWDRIRACRDGFNKALGAVDEKIADARAKVSASRMKQTPPKKAVSTMMPVQQKTAVFFGFGKARLSKQARATLDEFVKGIADKDDVELLVVGHTDTVGSASYNMKLSRRRADAVMAVLRQDGMHVRRFKTVHVVADGENHLIVKTGNDVRERANRCVEVTVHAMRKSTTTSSTGTSGTGG